MVDLASWDIPTVGWAAVISSTGIEPRQLRSALDRGLLPFGTKQSNRLMFTLRERMGIDVAAMLTSLWVPISVACDVAASVAPNVEAVQHFWLKKYLAEVAAHVPDIPDDFDRLLRRVEAAARPQIDDVPSLSLLVEQAHGKAELSFLTNRPSWTPEAHCSFQITDRQPLASINVSLMEAMKRHIRYILSGDEEERPFRAGSMERRELLSGGEGASRDG